MNLLLGTVGSFVAIACFAVLLECPRKYLLHAGCVGAVGGGVYLFSMDPVSYTHLTLPTIA